MEIVTHDRRVGVFELPDELLEHRYVVLRDEMLWRAYRQGMAIGDDDGVGEALRVLRVIRESPD